MIKRTLRKLNSNHQSLPERNLVNTRSVTKSNSVAENSNKYFAEIGEKFKTSSESFPEYLRKYGSEL